MSTARIKKTKQNKKTLPIPPNHQKNQINYNINKQEKYIYIDSHNNHKIKMSLFSVFGDSCLRQTHVLTIMTFKFTQILIMKIMND